jgi:hypothetical protein
MQIGRQATWSIYLGIVVAESHIAILEALLASGFKKTDGGEISPFRTGGFGIAGSSLLLRIRSRS